MINGYNVLFVTLDACRFDTTQLAHTPFFDSLGGFKLALTHGDYTFPAHMSFFMGYLPYVSSYPFEPYYNSGVKQLWRLASGRSRSPETCGIVLSGVNILDGYRNLGYYVIGSGGVRWFRHQALTSLFDDFLFYGETDLNSVFKFRKKREFPLSHQDELVNKIKDKNYFMFLNCPETHVPYDIGTGPLIAGLEPVIEECKPIWGFKFSKEKSLDISYSDLKIMHNAQVAALESVDGKLKSLVDTLPTPLLLVITADHGECFGEEGHWGHGYPHKKVMDVPLLITTID